MTFPLRLSNLTRIIGVLAMALTLQACSAVKIAYNQAPTLAYLYLDGYIDFNDPQSTQVKAELTRFQAWHRQSQLPGYMELLQKMQPQMLQDMTAAQACDVYADIRQKALALADHAEPVAASVATSLTPRQLDAMQRKFAKTNTTWRDDYLDGSPKDLLEKRQKSAVKRADMLYGSVNDRQRALIAQQIERSMFKPSQNYGERLRRQKDVLQTLGKVSSSAQDVATSQQDMRNLLARTLASPDPAYRRYLDTITQEGCASFAELHNITTVEQRKKAVQVLAGYEQDFKVLLGQK